jgi:hypothetical protein
MSYLYIIFSTYHIRHFNFPVLLSKARVGDPPRSSTILQIISSFFILANRLRAMQRFQKMNNLIIFTNFLPSFLIFIYKNNKILSMDFTLSKSPLNSPKLLQELAAFLLGFSPDISKPKSLLFFLFLHFDFCFLTFLFGTLAKFRKGAFSLQFASLR